MAFSSVPTITTGDVATASWGNTYIKNNFALTAPAVLTAQGDIVIASGANTPIRLAKDTNSTRSLTNTGGGNNAPAWAQVALATGVSGTLPVGNGGTGATSLTANGVIIGNTASALTSVDMSTKGHILVGDGSGNPQMLSVGGTDDFVLTVDSGEATGIKWAVASGGLVLVGTAVASGSATLDITGLGSTYDTYLLAIADIHPGTDGADMWLRVGDSGGVDSGASDYSYHIQNAQAGGSTYGTAFASTGAAQILLSGSNAIGGAAGEGAGAVLWLHRPGDGSTKPFISGTLTRYGYSGELRGGMVMASRNAVITLDRVQVLMNTGDIATGRFTVWGLKHA